MTPEVKAGRLRRITERLWDELGRALALAVLLGCAAGIDPDSDECMRTLFGCPPVDDAVLVQDEIPETYCPPFLLVSDGVPQLDESPDCEETEAGWECSGGERWWCRSRFATTLDDLGRIRRATEVRVCDGFPMRECSWARYQQRPACDYMAPGGPGPECPPEPPR